MRKSDFQFDLPSDLIAQNPLAERSASQLLLADARDGSLRDLMVRDLPDLLDPKDLLVFNDTRVLPARLWGRKQSGGQVEILIERVLDAQTALAHLRVSKKPQPGSRIEIVGGGALRYLDRDDALFRVEAIDEPIMTLMERAGHMPLPPYIERDDSSADRERYQTVFSKNLGAVAAPTAGLHFDQDLLATIAKRGISTATLTLHVGAGTFQPVREEDLSQHHMHKEWIDVSLSVVNAVNACKQRGGRVIAIGTTVTRALESAAHAYGGVLHAYSGETDIFITPGFQFKVIDAQFTNFHLSESTLLMLVSAIGGYEFIRHAYAHAIDQRYRFFSYGDAMLIWPSITCVKM